ncbi:hypothetical protein SO802_013726 [Lithocarpus litseifolius]|uniref:Calmodulin-binding protein n=1 Tax=Lithocarpus litseifolius TaxID=425828 RepID=A0AAW2D6E8_9ROSI
MVEKRRLNGKGGDDFERSKRRQALQACAFKNIITELLNGNFLEPFLRNLVREEVQQAFLPVLQPSLRPSFHQAGTSGVRSLQLRFINKLSSKIYTNNTIKAEDSTPIQIELFDTSSRTRVKSGQLSSIKIRIVVLNGDFPFDEEEDWSKQEFNAKVLQEREGKRPLLYGDATVTLKEGVGSIGDIIFTDNSSWMRSRKFRLGAIVQKPHTEVGIREGRSEPFMVKDHRGETNQKHYPPSLSDEIWRLKTVGKDGAFHQRLASHKISTVEDLLRKYVINPSELRKIFGRISDGTWESIIGHAMTCNKDDGMKYIYHIAGESVGLLFNSIYQVVAATFDGQEYFPLDSLDFYQKQLVETLKQHAYENENDIVPFNAAPIARLPMPSAGLQAEPFSVPEFGFPITHQDQPETLLGFNHSENHAAECSYQLEDSLVLNSHAMLRNSSVMEEYLPGLSNAGYGWSTSVSEVQDITWGPQNGFFLAPGNEADVGNSLFPNSDVHILSTRKPKASWCKIRAAVKWGSVRRGVAARRMQGRMQGFCISTSLGGY